MFKIICYGVRPNEVEIFETFNRYDYALTLEEALLTHDNIETAKGHDAVLLRGNCVADRENLTKMKEYGIRYVFTRTVGFNHIDLEAAKEFGQMVARVPGYSPNSVAELAMTLGMTLLRNVQYTADRTHGGDFRVTPRMFSREVRNCTVGIVGVGKIGLVEAELYRGLGAHVLGYDPYPSDVARKVVEFTDLDTIARTADIVSIHVPYFKGENDNFINAEFLAKMKDDAILVNTARGELVDLTAVADALEEDRLYGFATDVIPNERDTFFKHFDAVESIPDPAVVRLVNCYPRALITPHVGSNTDEAVKNMVETSFENFNTVLTTGTCANLMF